MTLYKCFTLRREGVPQALYYCCRVLHPKIICSNWLRFEGRTGENVNLFRIAGLVMLARAFGLHRTIGGDPGSFGYEVVRDYEQSDLAACGLLLLRGHPTKYQLDHDRDAQGRLLLSSEFMDGLSLGNAWGSIVVSRQLRDVLDNARLIGLQFEEAVPLAQGFTEPRGSFWEVRTSVVLPKMANTYQLKYIGLRGTPPEPFAGDYSRAVFLDDPPYRAGEIHYRREELALLGKFDIAQTFELYRQPHRQLVISQRFYQTCQDSGVSLAAEPVRIVPEKGSVNDNVYFRR